MKKKLGTLALLAGLLTAPALLHARPASPASPTSPAPKGDGSLIDQLGWMQGRWVSEGAGRYIEETWSPARDDAMVGALRWSRQGNVWLYELMSIEEQDDELVFHLRHFDRGLEPWASETDGPLTYPLQNIGENLVVFENPERDEPRRFVYERKGDTLTIRLEDPAGNDPNPFRFRLDS